MASTAHVPPAGHRARLHTVSPRGCVLTWLREASDLYADQPAVRGDGWLLRYRELDGRVRAFAAALLDRGARRGDLIALSAGRSADLLAAALAVLRIGAVVCPVDLRQAPERTQRLLAGLRPRMILADDSELATAAGAVSLSALSRHAAADQEAVDVSAGTVPAAQDLAYIEHTSGSTGRPKAVAVPHGALANVIAWTQHRYPIGVGDTLLHAGSLTYDICFWDILAPLCFGAAIALAPDGMEAEPAALAKFISDSQVTVLHFTPSLLAEFLDAADMAHLTNVRYAFCGGERLHCDLARRMLGSVPARLFNRYGPTETCIYVTDHEVTDQYLASESVPIGQPIWGITARVLDAQGLQVADGEPGVLHIGGTGLAWGYLDMSARTAAAFIPDPWSDVPGARLYRTGDIVRRRTDGLFEFLRRVDDQVKIRGVRVELAEVENALLRHPAVSAAALTIAADQGQPVLVAHLVAAAASDDDIRSFLADQLPQAAIPAYYIRRRSLPKLPSGKTDRARLHGVGLPGRQAGATSAAPPLTETERRIAEIWSEVLKAEPVGRSDHFFQLGGQSLLAMRMIARVRRQFGIRVSARAIFDAPTVDVFSAFIDTMLTAQGPSSGEASESEVIPPPARHA